jgi:hypothetical protein
MNAKELSTKLEELILIHGDLPVVHSDQGSYELAEFNEIEVGIENKRKVFILFWKV